MSCHIWIISSLFNFTYVGRRPALLTSLIPILPTTTRNDWHRLIDISDTVFHELCLSLQHHSFTPGAQEIVPGTSATVTQATTTSAIDSMITQISSTVPHSILTSSAAKALSTSSTETLLVCAGHGFDYAATGIIATVVIPSALGLILWVGKFHSSTYPIHVQPTLWHLIFRYIARVRHTEAPLPTNLCPSRVVCSTQVSFSSH